MVATHQTPSKNSLNLVKVENWGYKRFWLAEHHNMQGSSSATVILIGANGTNSLRVWRNNASKPCATSSRRTVYKRYSSIELICLGRAPGTDLLLH
jgi:hypothetical protein